MEEDQFVEIAKPDEIPAGKMKHVEDDVTCPFHGTKFNITSGKSRLTLKSLNILLVFVCPSFIEFLIEPNEKSAFS